MRGFRFAAAAAVLSIAAFTLTVGMVGAPSPRLSTAERTTTQSREEAAGAYAKLPVAFVENRGQIDAGVRYYAQGDHYAFYLTPGAVMLTLAQQRAADATSGQAGDAAALALRVPRRGPESRAPRSRYGPPGWSTICVAANRLVGAPTFRSSATWCTPTCGRTSTCGCVSRSGVLKYEFHVRPGASPADIALAYGGAHGLAVGADGGLQISTGLGRTDRLGPRLLPGHRRRADPGGQPVRAGTAVHRRGTILLRRRRLSGRPRTGDRPGRAVHDLPRRRMRRRPARESRSTRPATHSSPAPPSPPTSPPPTGAFRRTGSAQNNADVFVTKLNPAGTALVYSTFVGGSDMEFGHGLAIDAAGNAYVTGTTKSSNFPTTGGAFDRSLNIPPNCPRCATDNTDGFAFKLNAAGSALLYSTYLGGTDIDSPRSDRRRRSGKRLRHRGDPVDRLPHDRRRIQPHAARRHTTCSSQS